MTRGIAVGGGDVCGRPGQQIQRGPPNDYFIRQILVFLSPKFRINSHIKGNTINNCDFL